MGKKPSILLAEDNESIKTIMQILFDVESFEVSWAEDGEKALALLSNGWMPDVIVTDWAMPNLNGLDLIKKIRSQEKYESIPILLLSANMPNQEVKDLESEGLFTYKLKGQDWREVVTLVKSWVVPRFPEMDMS